MKTCTIFCLFFTIALTGAKKSEDAKESGPGEDQCEFGSCPNLDPNDSDIAIITAGNSGVGKSFIDNIIVGEDVFLHKYRPSSVTRETEAVVTKLNGKIATVFNIPGLMESKKENVALNKIEIEKAFLGKSAQVILFVFGVGDGGRIRDEDFATFLAMNKAYEFSRYSLVFVFNNVKPFKLTQDRDEYHSMTIINLKELLQWPPGEHFRAVFAEDFSDEVDYYLSTRVAFFREDLVNQILNCVPFRHEKKHNIELNDEKLEEAKKMLDHLKSEYETLRSSHVDEIAKMTRKMEQQRTENEKRQQQMQNELNAMRSSGGRRRRCFPSNAMVEVKTQGMISMESLNYGDQVKCLHSSGSVGYCEVYLFGHRNPNTLSKFTNLRTKSNQTLQLSPTHFAKICVRGCTASGLSLKTYELKALYASEVRVGDLLVTLSPSSADVNAGAAVFDQTLVLSPVEEIWTTVERGLYNPFIRSGNLFVDGVVASPHSEWILDQFTSIPRDWLPFFYELMLLPIYLIYLLIGPASSDMLAMTLGIHASAGGLKEYLFVLLLPVIFALFFFQVPVGGWKRSNKALIKVF